MARIAYVCVCVCVSVRLTPSPGADLRKKGLNRIGNLLIPNNNYCVFETWVMPILDAMVAEQKATAASKVGQRHGEANTLVRALFHLLCVFMQDPQIWSPSKMIRRLGLEINNPNSVFYWCAKNDIPGTPLLQCVRA